MIIWDHPYLKPIRILYYVPLPILITFITHVPPILCLSGNTGDNKILHLFPHWHTLSLTDLNYHMDATLNYDVNVIVFTWSPVLILPLCRAKPSNLQILEVMNGSDGSCLPIIQINAADPLRRRINHLLHFLATKNFEDFGPHYT